MPGGIGTYIRGLAGGLRSAGPGRVDLTLWASRAARTTRSGSAGDEATVASTRRRGWQDPLAGLGRVVASGLPGPVLTRAWDHGMCRPPREADVVHAGSLAVPPRGRAPISVMIHDLAWLHEPDAYPQRGLAWHEAALGRARRRGAAFVTPSAETAEDLAAAGFPEHLVSVIEEGCDHLAPADHDTAEKVLTALSVPPEGEYLLTVSTLEPRKNLRRLLDAHAIALPHLPEPWPLVVVGPTGWGPAIAPRPSVAMAGEVSCGTLSALYERARMVAFVPRREGWGLPAVEAMACGAPVVASHVPSTGGAAYEVPHDDVEAIAAALVTVGSDEDVRATLVELGRARASLLTWDRAASEHLDLWEGLAAG